MCAFKLHLQFDMQNQNSAMTSGTGSDSTKTTDQQTYPNAIAKTTAPTREQAIVLDSIEGFTIDDYVDGLEKVIDLNHIRFISKISGLRVCIYLSNTQLVEGLANKQITVKNTALKIRPLF